jgi:hypothetical protein
VPVKVSSPPATPTLTSALVVSNLAQENLSH